MKNIKMIGGYWPVALALLASLLLHPGSARAQGSLTPPGGPAPTMKSLDQVEARTAITNSAGLVTIAQPGSYYLTHNLTVSTGDGIDITNNDVTLDLNGFTISSTAPSANGNGILLGSGLVNITIHHGHISGSVADNGGTYSGGGFAEGIYYSGNPSHNVRVANVSVFGCLDDGINLYTGASSVVESCVVDTVGGNGVVARTVDNSVASACGNNGIFATTALNSNGSAVGSGYGLYATEAENCAGSSSTGTGLYALGTAATCSGSSGSGTGLIANNGAQNCTGSSGTSTGLYCYASALNCYGQTSGGYGLFTSLAENCYGFSYGNTGYGVFSQFAFNTYGSSSGGTALYAYAANSSYGFNDTSAGTGVSATYANFCFGYPNVVVSVLKYNMP